VLDVVIQRQRDKGERQAGLCFWFHTSPPNAEPFVAIHIRGKFHYRRPGAPSVGRALLATLNAIGAVRGGPGR
jgi:hypothetical protein